MFEGSVSADRLDSWKEIAVYVKRSVRTVIRWETQKGFPVHRIPGGERQNVFAYRREIDSWMQSGSTGSLDEVRDAATDSPVDALAFSTRPQAFATTPLPLANPSSSAVSDRLEKAKR